MTSAIVTGNQFCGRCRKGKAEERGNTGKRPGGHLPETVLLAEGLGQQGQLVHVGVAVSQRAVHGIRSHVTFGNFA